MELTLRKVNQNFFPSPEENIVDENAVAVFPVLIILAAVSRASRRSHGLSFAKSLLYADFSVTLYFHTSQLLLLFLMRLFFIIVAINFYQMNKIYFQLFVLVFSCSDFLFL